MVVVALDCEETKHRLCDIGCDWLPVVVTLDVIGCLLQTSMLQSIERYMKQAIVDKVPGVSSAALVSSLVSASFCPSGSAVASCMKLKEV